MKVTTLETQNIVCAFCKDAIAKNSVTCNACLAVYHSECFNGCSVYGCSNTARHTPQSSSDWVHGFLTVVFAILNVVAALCNASKNDDLTEEDLERVLDSAEAEKTIRGMHNQSLESEKTIRDMQNQLDSQLTESEKTIHQMQNQLRAEYSNANGCVRHYGLTIENQNTSYTDDIATESSGNAVYGLKIQGED